MAAHVDSAAHQLGPLLRALLGSTLPVRLEFWDGSAVEADTPDGSAPGTVRVNSPDAVRRLLWSPDELGLGRAYVAGDLDAEGDIVAMVATMRDAAPKDLRLRAKAAVEAIAAARRAGVIGRPLPPPPQEARLTGWRHSLRRDQQAISHHYDVGNDFYRLVLGPSMTYSCARFVDDATSLDDAQAAKHDLVCRKLGLDQRDGHASARRRVRLGIDGDPCGHALPGVRWSASRSAANRSSSARKRVSEAGVGDRVEIRMQDYRELGDEQFDAISSIGMAEHVGAKRLDEYFSILHGALVPTGRLLNHAISSVGGSRMGRRSFVGRYVFPDGELIDVGARCWRWSGPASRCATSSRCASTTPRRCGHGSPTWRPTGTRPSPLPMSPGRGSGGSTWPGRRSAFDDGDVNVHQVLGVVPAANGASAIPATRAGWV